MSQFQLDLGYQYKSLKSRSRSLKAVEDQAQTRGAIYPEFGADFFNALFQKSPKLRDDIDFNNKYNQVLRAFSQSERFQAIRQQTKGNLNWSAIAASMLLDEISKTVNFEDEPEPEPQEDSEQGQNEEEKDQDNSEPTNDGDEDNGEGDNSEDQGDKSESDDNGEDSDSTDDSTDANDSGDSDSDEDSDLDEDSEGQGEGEDSDEGDLEDGEGTDQGWGESNDKGEPSDELGEDFGEYDDDDSLEDGPELPVDEAIEQAIDKAADKIDEMMKGIKAGHGSSIPGGDVKMVDDYAKLATNANLVKLLRMVGRLKLNNNFLSALSTANPEESMGVTIGNNIQRTLPRDLVRLVGDDDDFLLFMQKYNNKELLQRKYKSMAKPGKGPMIVCVDTSSSMSMGGRYEWAQTIAAAMYMLAHKDNRLFAVVEFDDTAILREPTSQVSKNLDVGMLSSILGLVPRGGTNFDAAWNKSIQFMRKHSGNWKNADIVFITDGECGFDKDQWIKDKDKLGVRLFSFLIGESEESAKGVWSEEYIRRLTQANRSQYNSYMRYYQHLFGQPVHPTIAELETISDAMCYVEKLDAESESQAFNLVKHAQQKKGKVVGAKR